MSLKPFGILSVSLIGLLISLPVTAVGSETVPSLVLRAGEHSSYDRIVFDAPKGFTYKYTRNQSSVSIAFSKAAKLTLKRNYLKRARGFALAEGKKGVAPLTVQFFVDPKAAVTHFKNDNSIVIDVKGKKLSDKALRGLKKPALAVKVKKKPLVKEKSAAKPTRAVKAEPRKKIKVTGPVAPTPKAAPVHHVEAVASPKMKLAWPPRIQNPMKKKDVKLIQSIASELHPKPVIVFDPKVAIGIAVFERAGYITILFDRKMSKDAFPDFKKARVPLIPFSLTHNAGYRIRVPHHIGVRVAHKGTAWGIFLVPGDSKPLLTTEFITQPSFALGARMLVPSAKPPKPVRITDPVVGDELLVVPFQEAGAFTVRRRLSDFQVIPSVQGLVIKPWHERVTARIVADGIEISSEGGLKLSSPEDMGTLQAVVKQNGNLQKSLFDFKNWRGRKGVVLAKKTQKLWQTIINVDKEERVLARLDLARLYFAHGFGYETLSILQVISKDLPDIERHPDFISIRGAARILVGRVKEGLTDLASPEIKQQPDVLLWRAVGNALLQDWKTSVSLFRKTMPLLETYPEPLRSRFWILAIESAVAISEKRDVVTWLAQIERDGYSPTVKSSILYLRAVLHSQAGRVDLAEKLWRKVADGKDRLYKIRAELALVDLGVATGSMTLKQATDRLEGLRYSWRGDGLELDVLKRLGVFYIKDKEYREGFKTLFQVLRLFPDAPQSKKLRLSMVKTFQDLFLTDLGKDLSPLQGLSLYTDFEALIPKGEDGNAVRRNLAERLVNIDLLDQAIALLADLLINAHSTKERVETGLRIAGIHLLDHKAEMALAALERTKEEAFAVSKATTEEWHLLHARTLSEQGKYQEALAALPAGSSQPSLLLRADMALKARNWTDATKALMSLVGSPPAAGKKISEERAGWVVNTALAMARNQDGIGLDKLAIDFGSVMDKTTKASVFRVLTRPDETTQLRNIKAAQSRLSEVDMFRGVLDSYRKARKK